MQLNGKSLKKWLLLLVAGIAFYFSFDFLDDFLDKQMLGDHPEVILAAKYGAKTSPRILSHTGEIFSEEYKMNTLDSKQDSLELDIKLEGKKATAIINTRAVKQVSGIWNIYRSDTTFTEQAPQLGPTKR
ncbi:hypothetical protein [Hymenobacter metallilatus]|uniref:Uncharacterized protein n=1 Tax=Hymenobacter metallilatus TaxID=2493666 RepID=A0A428JRV2_9BACT|nr:hypothetical protein [Hymenobacter metallilatus]RSK36309.1 hypothetical protein EI290_05355 [Hymenobacter metallilatus]